jgi:hypothetical protein
MKITIKKTVEETHELELPAYRKNICYYYKIVSEEKAIQICFAKGSESIAISYTSSALKFADQICNQEEFDLKFNEVVTVLMEKASV